MNLFDVSTINGMVLENHFFRSATSEGKATVDGHLTKELCKLYRDLSTSGIGTIITGYAYICKDEQPESNMMGIYDDSFIEEYKAFTELVHENGANIIMQIVYGGSLNQRNPSNTKVLEPSSISNSLSGITPIEMSHEEIKTLIRYFADAALRIKKSEFDGVQIHAAHGYLLSQFLSPIINQRTDQYGGEIQNRARIIMEVYAAVREKVGNDYPVMIKLNLSDNIEGGLTYTESLEFSKMLADAGIDAIEVSGSDFFQNPSSKEAESYFINYAMELSELVSTPIILTGGNRGLEFMEKISDNSHVQYFGFSRPLLSDSNFVKKLEEANKR